MTCDRMDYLHEQAIPQNQDAYRAENTSAGNDLLSPEFLVPHPMDYRREPIDEKRNCACPQDCGDARQRGERRLRLRKGVMIEYAGWQDQLPQHLKDYAPKRQGKC